MIEQLKQLSEKYFDFTVQNRQYIHAHPELSFEEFNTSAYIQEKLKAKGIPFEIKAKTGIVARIDGKKGQGAMIALRADLDALPIQEQNTVSYKSTIDGRMHACGHDVHSASLLSTAYILKDIEDSFCGTVLCIFQPGEEKLPGGASLLIKEGVLNHPNLKGIIGQHVMPLIHTGNVGFREGKYMASTDELYITIQGKGGHGAMPQFAIDPVVIAAHVIIGLQQVISRIGDTRIPSVLTIGKVEAKGATNVIPTEVQLEGTFRTLDEAWRKIAHEKIKTIAEGIAQSFGAGALVRIEKGYPYLENNPEFTRICRHAAESYLGSTHVEDLDVWMAAEDFSYYTHEVPGTFYRLGIRNEAKGITASVHHPQFNIDEEALKFSPGLMAYLAISGLEA